MVGWGAVKRQGLQDHVVSFAWPPPLCPVVVCAFVGWLLKVPATC